jgi:Fe-Mn family superoxide dismutase
MDHPLFLKEGLGWLDGGLGGGNRPKIKKEGSGDMGCVTGVTHLSLSRLLRHVQSFTIFVALGQASMQRNVSFARKSSQNKKMSALSYDLPENKPPDMSTGATGQVEEVPMNRSLILMIIALPLMMAAQEVKTMLHFEPLPYEYSALEPHIDAKTMEIHYSRHHKAYFDNLQKAVADTALAEKPIEAILAEISKWPAAVRNNGGGHWNHTLFWKLMSPKGGGQPQGALAQKIDAAFGSFTAFQDEFKKAALGRFGSGWAWLVLGADGSLFITSTPNQDNPLMDVAEQKGTPLLAIDVWEHAYYLKFQNLRASYVDAFWQVVNWREVENRYEKGRK